MRLEYGSMSPLPTAAPTVAASAAPSTVAVPTAQPTAGRGIATIATPQRHSPPGRVANAGPAQVGAAVALEPLQKKTFRPQNDTVLVIGAGVAAMGLVRALVDNKVPPKNITVVERGSAAGGKVHSVRYDGHMYELGAQVIIPKLYAEIEKLVAELGLSPTALPRGTAIDATTGVLGPIMTEQEQAQLKEQLGRYITMYGELWHQPNPSDEYRLLDARGFLHLPPSLRMTWPEFVRQNHFEMIDKVLASLLTGANYRDNANPAPASRIVRVLRPEIFQSLFVEGNPAKIFAVSGYQEVWKRVAADLEAKGVKFSYGTEVHQITRSSEGQMRATLSGAGGEFEVAPDHVVYTGSLSAWGNLLTDLTPAEQELLSKVVTSDFRSYLVKLDGLATSKLGHLVGKVSSSGIRPYIFGVPQKDGSRSMIVGEPVLMIKPHPDTNVAVVYVNGDATLTTEQAQRNITAALAKLGVTASVLEEHRWPYFPRPLGDAQAIDQGIMACQGLGGAWLAGSYFAYEATHEAFRNGREFGQLLHDGQL